jgi:translation initiation factor 2 subunit 3
MTEDKCQLPEVNIGLVGHIDHGKTSLTERLSGVWTDRHSEELKRGITIRLGYADCKFYKCPKCKEPDCYSVKKECPKCKAKTELARVVSFVDAPGHETLMATMLTGAAIMDGAILVIAANEECPQPQTKEHLMALDIVGVKNIIIVQNKIDLIKPEKALENYNQIKEFVKGTVAEKAPIIPVSAQHGTNIDVLIKTIEEKIPSPGVKPGEEPIMYLARSFDINKPGSDPTVIKGGVLGGALVSGELKEGELVEIGPMSDGGTIKTKIRGITCGGSKIKKVGRGGTFGLETGLDPALTKADGLSGKVLGIPGKMPPIKKDIAMEIHLLERVVGSKDELEIKPLINQEPLMLNTGTATTVGVVSVGKKQSYTFKLKLPVCARVGDRVTIARRFGTRWRLIGYGVIQ